MIQLPSVIQLLPNIYSFGHKVGLTLGKYYVLLLVATKDISLLGTSSSGSGSGSGSSSLNDTTTTCSTINYSMDGLNAQQQLLLLQQLPKQIYTMIITFPVWYSEWWWNLVQNDPIHVLVETFLLVSILYFLVSRRGMKSYKEQQSSVDQLTKQEEDELIAQWIRHERQPLTPYTTSSTNSSSSNSGNYRPTSTLSSSTSTLNEYRPTLVIHKNSGRFMQVEEVQHPASNSNSSSNTASSKGAVVPSTIPTTTLSTVEGNNGTSNTTPTSSNISGIIEPGVTSVVTSMIDGLSSDQSTTVPTLASVPFGANIIQVLNFATMDFLGMSSDTVPTSMDDDDDDDNNNDGIFKKDDENAVPVPVLTTTNTNKNSKRSVNSATSILVPTKPTTTKKIPQDRPLHPVKVASLEALDRYGCGSCGPRGFYGTIDVHLRIERNIASFLHTEDAILYSDGASTVTSTIAAFCKRGDIIIVDEAVYEPIRTGVQLSRANIKWFAHNDMNDLRRILSSIQQSDKKRGRKSNAQRRFIVVEGLYKNTGSICPLNELIALKHEFSCRLILDESFSFGTLGPTGRGVTELYQQKVMHDVEITCVSLENAMGSIGGLTTGIEEVVDHQRLSGSGYCYSASSPPFTASAAIAALNLLQTRPDITIQRLNRNLTYLHQQLQILLHDKLEDLLIVTSDVRSPIILLQVADIPETEYLDEVVFLQEVVRESFIRGVAFVATATGTSAVVPETTTGAAVISSHLIHPETGTGGFLIDLPSSIRMTVSAVHTLADIDFAIQVLGESVDVVMSRFYDEETTM